MNALTDTAFLQPMALGHGGTPSHPGATTLFLGAPDMVHLVQQVGLRDCFTGVAERIRSAFARWESFDKAPRTAAHSAQGVIELMPVADATDYAFKYVNGHPGNTRDGLPTVMAFGVLADVATGAPRLLCELTLLTAIRTAAMSVVAAQALARPDSRRMALIGNGAQAEFQALAFRDALGIRTLRLFDTDPAATAKLQRNLADSGLELIACTSIAQAVQGADIVTTVTADKRRATILTPEMIEPGMHLNAVGGDCPGKTELHPAVLQGARVYVEYEPQTRVEGDIQQMPSDFPVTELWRVLTRQAVGRTNSAEVTVFDSVGFALEDYAAMAFVRERATELGLGRSLELVGMGDDPKDLYAALRQPATTPAGRA